MEFLGSENPGHVSMDGDDGRGSKVVAEDTERCDHLPIMSEFRRSPGTQYITHWVVDGVAVPQPCSEGWVNKLIHGLKRVDIRVGPR